MVYYRFFPLSSMLKKLSTYFDKIIKGLFPIVLSALILFSTSFYDATFAARSNMTGNYSQDTISVINALTETIELPKDEENNKESRDEALMIITDYISRYRNRNNINTTQSFTTMQTALNAMAGHYKNFSTRPLPNDLKERLNKEFSIAKKLVLRES